MPNLWKESALNSRTASLLSLLWACAACSALGAGYGGGNLPLDYEKRPPYRAGTGDSVKDLGPQNAAEAQKSGKPVFLYIYDPTPGDTPWSEYLEKKVLSNGTLKNARQHFTALKVKADGSDAQGWPKEWLAGTSGSAAIMLISSDGKNVRTFGRSMGKQAVQAKFILVAVKEIFEYERKIAEIANEAKANAAAAEKPPTKDPPPAQPAKK